MNQLSSEVLRVGQDFVEPAMSTIPSWESIRPRSLSERATQLLIPHSIGDQIVNGLQSRERISSMVDPWDPETEAVVLTISDGILASVRLLEDQRLRQALINNKGVVIAMLTPGNPRMRSVAEDLETYVGNKGLTLEIRALPDLISPSGYRDAYSSVLGDYPKAILNGIGGTKIMADAASEVFIAANRPVVQLNPTTSEVTHTFGTKGIIGLDYLQGQPALVDMLKLDGLTVVEQAADTDRDYSDGQLDRLVDTVSQDTEKFWEIQSIINTSGPKSQIEGFEDLPMVVGGGWLPEYLKKQIDKLRRSGVVDEVAREVLVETGDRKDKLERYDIDIAAQALGRPIFIEAKAVSPFQMREVITATLSRIIRRDIAGRKGPVNAIVLSAPVESARKYLKKIGRREVSDVLGSAIGEANRRGVTILSSLDFNDKNIGKTLRRLANKQTR